MAVYLIAQKITPQVSRETRIKHPFKSSASYTDGIGRAAEMAIKKLPEWQQASLVASGYDVMLYEPVLEVEGKGVTY